MTPRPMVPPLGSLAASWRARAEELRQWGAEGPAKALERAAAELEASLRAGADEALTLEAASKESGYSADHLGRLVRQGKLANVGAKHAPRVRRAELPTKRARRPALTIVTPDGSLPDAIAREAISAKLTTTRRA